jgi:large subunit ribosomal protein L10
VNRSEKQQHVENLRRELQGIQSAFLFGYRGLTVNQVTDLRTRIRKTESTYRVLKNRLVARAVEATPLAPLREHLRGPLAMTFHRGQTEALAKVLIDFAKENPAFEFKAGLLEGRPISGADLASLASLPTREVLVARFLGLLNAPISSFQRVLLAPVRDFASVLDQIAKKKQAG